MKLLRQLAWGGAILGAVGVLLHLFVFDLWVVPNEPQLAASILPTLAPEDKMLVLRGRVPGYGQLARCASPYAPGSYVVGRVYGVAGDEVRVERGEITTNGKRATARHLCDPVTVAHPETQNLVTMSCAVSDTGPFSFSYLNAPSLETGTQAAIVEVGKLFLVSDNRLMRQDSRDFGPIDAATCEHIVYRLWGETYADASRRFSIVW